MNDSRGRSKFQMPADQTDFEAKTVVRPSHGGQSSSSDFDDEKTSPGIPLEEVFSERTTVAPSRPTGGESPQSTSPTVRENSTGGLQKKPVVARAAEPRLQDPEDVYSDSAISTEESGSGLSNQLVDRILSIPTKYALAAIVALAFVGVFFLVKKSPTPTEGAETTASKAAVGKKSQTQVGSAVAPDAGGAVTVDQVVQQFDQSFFATQQAGRQK